MLRLIAFESSGLDSATRADSAARAQSFVPAAPATPAREDSADHNHRSGLYLGGVHFYGPTTRGSPLPACSCPIRFVPLTRALRLAGFPIPHRARQQACLHNARKRAHPEEHRIAECRSSSARFLLCGTQCPLWLKILIYFTESRSTFQ